MTSRPPLRRLVELGMLVISADGPLRFRTPLIREAFAAAALPGERTKIHSRARSFAVELCDDEALARHAAFLGRHDEAAEAARRAVAPAPRPEALLATAPRPGDVTFRSASTAALLTGRFALAADYASRYADVASDLVDRADAYRQAALTRWRLGDVDGHRTNFEAAAKLSAEATAQGLEGARRSAARQLAAEAEALLRTVPPAEAVAVAQAALDAAVEAGEPTAPAMVTLGTALALSTGAAGGPPASVEPRPGAGKSLPPGGRRRFSETATEPLAPIIIERFARVPRFDPGSAGGDHERGIALIRAGRLLAEQRHDLVTVGRAITNLVAAKLPGAGIAAGWYLLDEATTSIEALGVECHAGRIARLGYEHALRAGDLARAESLVWGRLPIETDPLERARFTSAAGLLAVERGDDALAARLLGRVNAERADLGQPGSSAPPPSSPWRSPSAAPARTRSSGLPDYVRSLPAGYHRPARSASSRPRGGRCAAASRPATSTAWSAGSGRLGRALGRAAATAPRARRPG